MGLSTKLIPISMTIKAANNDGIQILGAAIVRFAGSSSDAQRLDHIFLSRTACVDLGVISDKFLMLREVNLATSDPCNCLRLAEPLFRLFHAWGHAL